jgi:hypothetical protein
VKTGAPDEAATVRTAGALVAVPTELVAVTVYVPVSASAAEARLKLAFVAPGSGTPSLSHWYAGAGVPLAEPEKLTAAPAKTV